MPVGSKGERRPADVISNAVKVMRIATSEETETLPADDGKDPAARALGKKGGAARAANMTPQRRVEIAMKAARTRWKKPDPCPILLHHVMTQNGTFAHGHSGNNL